MEKVFNEVSSYPKHDPIRNYFSVPNKVFMLRLFSEELTVYCYILFCKSRTTYPMLAQLPYNRENNLHEP